MSWYLRKFFNPLKQIAKYSTYTMLITTIPVGCYLYWIEMNLPHMSYPKKEDIVRKLIEAEPNITRNQAVKIYYARYFDIYFNRILHYRQYSADCYKFNKKIIRKVLDKYQQEGILKIIQQKSISNQPFTIKNKKDKDLYQQINKIRANNIQNIEFNQYLLPNIRKWQELLYTTKLVNVSEEDVVKTNKVFTFVVELCKVFEKEKTESLMQDFKYVKSKYPEDYLHKILFI